MGLKDRFLTRTRSVTDTADSTGVDHAGELRTFKYATYLQVYGQNVTNTS